MSPPTPLLRIAQMHAYVPGEQPAAGARVVKLNTNERSFPPSPAVLTAIREVAGENLRVYPDPSATRFREVAAELHGLTPDHLIAGNGSDDILTIITRTFVPTGGSVVSPWPTYSLYSTLCDIQGARHIQVSWRNDWQLPIDDLLAAKADAIYLANPNAPSGTFVPPSEIAGLAVKFKGIVLVDEAYADFADENCIELLSDHANVVVSRTLSKGYGLAGLRFGYALAHPHLIRHMAKVKDSYNTDALSQAAACAALLDQEHARGTWQHVRGERARVTLDLQLMGFVVPQSHANFVLAEHDDAPSLYGRLREQGILLRWWDTPLLRRYLRITIGTVQENNALLAALRQTLSGELSA